jgi:BolA protein
MPYNITDIEQSLKGELSPDTLSVRDDSAKHIGHAGYREGVLTHISIEITAPCFAGLSRLAKHRLVTNALKTFFDKGLHAVSIKA